jgi:hypothetical protein
MQLLTLKTGKGIGVVLEYGLSSSSKCDRRCRSEDGESVMQQSAAKRRSTPKSGFARTAEWDSWRACIRSIPCSDRGYLGRRASGRRKYPQCGRECDAHQHRPDGAIPGIDRVGSMMSHVPMVTDRMPDDFAHTCGHARAAQDVAEHGQHRRCQRGQNATLARSVSIACRLPRSAGVDAASAVVSPLWNR